MLHTANVAVVAKPSTRLVKEEPVVRETPTETHPTRNEISHTDDVQTPEKQVQKSKQRAHKTDRPKRGHRRHVSIPTVGSGFLSRGRRSLSYCKRPEPSPDEQEVKRLRLTIDILRGKLKQLNELTTALEEDTLTATNNMTFLTSRRLKLLTLTLENQLTEASELLQGVQNSGMILTNA